MTDRAPLDIQAIVEDPSVLAELVALNEKQTQAIADILLSLRTYHSGYEGEESLYKGIFAALENAGYAVTPMSAFEYQQLAEEAARKLAEETAKLDAEQDERGGAGGHAPF